MLFPSIREMIQHGFKFQYPSEFRRDNAREISWDGRIVEIKPVCVSLVGNIVIHTLISDSSFSDYHITRHLRSSAQISSAKGRLITANFFMEAYTIMKRHCSTRDVLIKVWTCNSQF